MTRLRRLVELPQSLRHCSRGPVGISCAGMSQTQRLLRRAAARLILASSASGCGAVCSWGRLLFLAYLAVARLLGLVAGSFFRHRSRGLGRRGAGRPRFCSSAGRGEQRVARLVDAHAGTKELFLSAVLQADGAGGVFLPVVQGEAEQRAPGIDLSRALPFRWTSGALQILVACALVAAALRWVPHLDPFRKVGATGESRAAGREAARGAQDHRVARGGARGGIAAAIRADAAGAGAARQDFQGREAERKRRDVETTRRGTARTGPSSGAR